MNAERQNESLESARRYYPVNLPLCRTTFVIRSQVWMAAKCSTNVKKSFEALVINELMQ